MMLMVPKDLLVFCFFGGAERCDVFESHALSSCWRRDKFESSLDLMKKFLFLKITIAPEDKN